MHTFEGDRAEVEAEPRPRRRALLAWILCTIVLIGPSLLVWLVRGVAYAYQCAPGPEPCHGMTLGGGLRDTLDLAWFAASNTTLSLAIALIAAIAGLMERRPILGALSMLVLPLAALWVPTLAVSSAAYNGCHINEAGVGDCALWGANMGMAFHQAAQTPWLIDDFMPYAVSLALMLGVLGFLFFRNKRA